MRLPSQIFQYVLLDKDYNILYLDNGAPRRHTLQYFSSQGLPMPVIPHPDGWGDIQIKFDTSDTYFALTRSFAIPLKFVLSGAEIIRYYKYLGKGYEEEIYIAILKFDHNRNYYVLEYKGKLDMASAKNLPLDGVLVDTIEGGTIADFNVNNGTNYDLQIDETNNDTVQVMNDGIKLYNTYNFSFIELSVVARSHDMPLVLESTEGDTVDVLVGNPTLYPPGGAPIPDSDYTTGAASSNYLIKCLSAAKTFILRGNITAYGSTLPVAGTFRYVIATDATVITRTDFSGVVLLSDNATSPTTVDINLQITLQPNEKLFIEYLSNTPLPGSINYLKSPLHISYSSRKLPTQHYCISLYYLMKMLGKKMLGDDKKIESVFLKANQNIVYITGDGLRNTEKSDVVPGYYAAMSFADFFQDATSIMYRLAGYGDLALKYVGDTIFVEPKQDLYIPDNPIFQLTNISNVEITFAEEKIFNTIKAGSPNQDYDNKGGKYEVNSEQTWVTPVKSRVKELNLVTKSRTDVVGMELLRSNFTGKNTTDNAGDKSAFMIDIDLSGLQLMPLNLNHIASGYIQVFSGAYSNYFKKGTKFIIEGYSFTVDKVSNLGVEFIIKTVEDTNIFTTIAERVITLQIFKPYRSVKTNIIGVPDDSFYNEYLSPRHAIIAHGAYIRSMMQQFQNDYIKISDAKKNKYLQYSNGDVVWDEDADIYIASLQDPLFLPFWISFKCVVPYTFDETLANLGTGYLELTYRGLKIQCLPIGSLSCKPASNEAQDWKLLLAATNSLATLLKLSDETIFITDKDTFMISSYYNPLWGVQYNYNKGDKYNYYSETEDFVSNRYKSFIIKPKLYAQKWQKTDSINLQYITGGIGTLSYIFYKCDGTIFSTGSFQLVNNLLITQGILLQQVDIPLASFPEGYYMLVIKSGTEVAIIFDWQDIRTHHPDTYVYEYYNTYNNVTNVFWNSYRPMIRVESLFMPPEPQNTQSDYEDEPRNVTLLQYTAYEIYPLIVGPATGIPDYMLIQMNRILGLDRIKIDNVSFIRDSGAKLEVNESPEGYPQRNYKINMVKPDADSFLEIDNLTAEAGMGAIIGTVHGRVFGLENQLIDVKIDDR